MALISENTLHFQGTNTALKEHSAGVQGTMNLGTSAKTLILQSKLKVAELDDMIYRDYNKRGKSWSDSPTATSVLSFAEALFKAKSERVPLYTSERVGERTFEVRFTPPPDYLAQKSKPATASQADTKGATASLKFKTEESVEQLATPGVSADLVSFGHVYEMAPRPRGWSVRGTRTPARPQECPLGTSPANRVKSTTL